MPSTCSICFCEFTADGSHRIISLKCGHIFGQECIEKWLFLAKNTHCPSCSASIRKAHLRPIFASEISATDNKKEIELIKNLQIEQEKNKVSMKKIRELKAEIDLLKMELQKFSVKIVKKYLIPKKFCKEEKLHFAPKNSIIEYEPVNNVILITNADNKFALYKYLISDFSIYSFIKFDSKITNIKISPFNDGLALLSHGSKVSIMNVLNENILFVKEFEFNVTAISFSKNRNIFFAGDSKGFFHIFEFDKMKSVKIMDFGILGIVESGNEVYIHSLFNVKKIFKDLIYDSKTIIDDNTIIDDSKAIINDNRIIDDNTINNDKSNDNKIDSKNMINNLKNIINTDSRFEDLQIERRGVFVGIDSFKSTVLLTIRDKESRIYFHLTGNKEIQLFSGVSQFQKLRNSIFGENIYLTDNSEKSIKVFEAKTFNFVHSFKMNEEIVDFVVKNDHLLILTQKRVYVFEV